MSTWVYLLTSLQIVHLYQKEILHATSPCMEYAKQTQQLEVTVNLVELAFGHSRPDGKRLPLHRIARAEKKSLTVFSRCFRGGQVYHLIGGYLTTDNRVVIQRSTVIRAYSLDVESHVEQLLALSREIACTLEQTCVLLTIAHVQGAMHWVEAKQAIPLLQTV
jgi:hypothetical protein